MTVHDTDAQMDADLALSAEVAERVMDWRWVTAPWFWDQHRLPAFGPDAHYLLPPGGVEATRDALGRWPTSGSFGGSLAGAERTAPGRKLIWDRMPAYARQMDAAWLVVALLRTRGWYCTLTDLTPREYPPACEGETWRCAFRHEPQHMDVAAEAATPARAICMAALRVQAAKDW
jgi:hypothetical protein